jgi:quinol monooxygenase YgiN
VAGSALGVALLVALATAANAVSGYDHAWWVQAGAGLLAAASLLLLRRRRSMNQRQKEGTRCQLQVIARHTMTAGKEAEVLALLPKLVAAARTEPGNVSFTAYRQLDDPRTYVVLERYASQEAFAEHRETDHIQDLVLGQIVPRLDSRVIETFDVTG